MPLREPSRQKLPLKFGIKHSAVSVFISLPVGIFGVGTLKTEVGELEGGEG